MLPIVFLVTLGLVTTGLILENDTDESSEDNASEGKPKARRKSTLRRLSMSVADAPRRTVSFFMGDQDKGSEDPAQKRPRSRSSFAESVSSIATSLAEAPRRLSRKVSFFIGEQGSEEPAEGRPRSFSGFAGRFGARRLRTQSCPVAGQMGNDETENLDLNAMD